MLAKLQQAFTKMEIARIFMRFYKAISGTNLKPARLDWLRIVAYLGALGLSSCISSSPAVPAATPTSSNIALGREVYLRFCAQCHGEDAQGHVNELDAPALDSSEHAPHHPDQQIYNWIVNGKLGLDRQMPAFGDQLSDTEVLAIIEYLRALWTPRQRADQQSLTERYGASLTPEKDS